MAVKTTINVAMRPTITNVMEARLILRRCARLTALMARRTARILTIGKTPNSPIRVDKFATMRIVRITVKSAARATTKAISPAIDIRIAFLALSSPIGPEM